MFALVVWPVCAEVKFGAGESVEDASAVPRFAARTEPSVSGLATSVRVERAGAGCWRVVSRVVNRASASATFKLVLEAETRFVPTRYLIPGVLYNGNAFGSDQMPKGLVYAKTGEPWVFSYDRSSIPSCTVVENGERLQGLFADDGTTNSLVSSSSLVRLSDGRFCQRIFWPATDAPVSYTGKKVLTERCDGFLTLAPGASFETTAWCVAGRPRWANYGFATVFDEAWRRLDHTVPPLEDDAVAWEQAMNWLRSMRSHDEEGRPWLESAMQDASHAIGNGQRKPGLEGWTLADIDSGRRKNHYLQELRPDGKNVGHGTTIGFSGQCFMTARLLTYDGLVHNHPEQVAFSRAFFDAFLKGQQDNGLLVRPLSPNPSVWERQTDAGEQGWGIVELVRMADLLDERGESGAERLLSAAERTAQFFLDRWSDAHGFGARWERDGTPVARGGDIGGFVVWGLVKLYGRTRREVYRRAAERALDFYFSRDVDTFACGGGAIDCQSVDKESSYPFLEAALGLYELTGARRQLERAERTAYYFASWMFTYNAWYPADSQFAQIGYRTAGGTLVGVEHACLDPYAGVAVSALRRLAKATGRNLWREVAETVWRNCWQVTATPGHDVFRGLKRPIGSQNEAFCQTRWTKYRAKPERGHLNDFIAVWQVDFRLNSMVESGGSDRAVNLRREPLSE